MCRETFRTCHPGGAYVGRLPARGEVAVQKKIGPLSRPDPALLSPLVLPARRPIRPVPQATWSSPSLLAAAWRPLRL
jgi:hypothetical protein